MTFGGYSCGSYFTEGFITEIFKKYDFIKDVIIEPNIKPGLVTIKLDIDVSVGVLNKLANQCQFQDEVDFVKSMAPLGLRIEVKENYV
jgi:hypothetical protein